MTEPPRQPLSTRWPLYRDIGIFCIGAIGVLVELGAWLFAHRAPDPSLLFLFAGALGLPLALRKDEK